MVFVSTKTLFKMEDQVMRARGLYAMWTCCYVAALSALGTDTTTGPSRDFLDFGPTKSPKRGSKS